jgi:hypothetical protein
MTSVVGEQADVRLGHRCVIRQALSEVFAFRWRVIKVVLGYALYIVEPRSRKVR